MAQGNCEGEAVIDLTKFDGHTAGPWSVGPAGTVYDAEGGVVSECFRDARHAGTARSDVSLIAAAPDLLAEVIRLRDALYSIDRQLGHDDADDALRDEITAALAGGDAERQVKRVTTALTHDPERDTATRRGRSA